MNILKNKKTIYICIAGIVVLVMAIFLFPYLYNNQYTIDMNIEDGDVLHIEYGTDATLPEVNATCKGVIFDRNGKALKVYVEGEYDLNTLGTYEITYKASYKDMICKRTVTIIVEDTTKPVIVLMSDSDNITKPNEKYVEEGYVAYDNYDGDLTSSVVRVEKEKSVSYVVTDSSGNTAVAERNIEYRDKVAPVITLEGDAYSTITVGAEYVEPGYKATDDCDGDVTDKVETSGAVNTGSPGIYILTYKVSDSAGNTCEIERNIIVADITAPVISLNGEDTIYVKLGEDFSDPGCSANDDIDGDVSDKVAVSGNVDVTKEGLYSLIYKVTDKTGNSAEATRKVYVYKKQTETDVTDPGDKVVYLTFDDGPGPYTQQLLDILDKYDVKVTFFVTNQYPNYRNLIGEAHRRGHTVALHTYSHKYESIYSSETAYFEDLQKIHDIVAEQTGTEPRIIRFPGGTSNAVSKKYCQGIMTRLSTTVEYRGYLYCDWNVSSSDAGGATTAEQVASNVIAGIKQHNVSVVLQHDTKQYSVEAVEEIVVWGLSNGYTFLAMSESTPMVHHGVNN